MSYLRQTIDSYVVEFGTRYDFILEQWLFHGLIRVPTDGYFSLTATDGVNTLIEYSLSSHPTISGLKTPADSVTGVCQTYEGFYVNCIAISGSMATSDSVTVPDFVLTLTPGLSTPFVLTSVATSCLYGSGLDDWVSVVVNTVPGQTTTSVKAWDNGTDTPNMALEVAGIPDGAYGVTHNNRTYYTLDAMGHRCSALKADNGYGSGMIPIFNLGSPITYYTGANAAAGDCWHFLNSKPQIKIVTSRRFQWEFQPADYTVAWASRYNALLRA